VVGLAIDWGIAVGISLLFFDYQALPTLAVFVVLTMLGGLFAAGTPGHLITGIRIAPIKGGALGIMAPLVLPAILSDEDMRGGHDRLVGTILVRR
jgi:hypothetical protein